MTLGLAGLAQPGQGGDLRRDLALLAEQKVRILVSLTLAPLPASALGEFGIAPVHLPVADRHAPSPAQIDRWIRLVTQAQAVHDPVAVHCAAGLGRTGTMLAAWFIASGQSTKHALKTIRTLRPGSVETYAQEHALRAFERRTQAP